MGNKGASLDPSTHTKGGAVPDGDYTIKSVRCGMFDYGGRADAVPALIVVYSAGAEEHEQGYSAGKSDRLVPSDDGHRMVHPRGEDASYAQGSNASLWLSSILKSGFPSERMSGDDVTVFAGAKVSVAAVAQPKRAGLRNSADNEGKTIPLVTKVLALPGASAAPARAAAPAAAASNGSGNLDATVIEAIQQALAAAPDNSAVIKSLPIKCLKFAKESNPNIKLNEITKLVTSEWLQANADAGGWTAEGETVRL